MLEADELAATQLGLGRLVLPERLEARDAALHELLGALHADARDALQLAHRAGGLVLALALEPLERACHAWGAAWGMARCSARRAARGGSSRQGVPVVRSSSIFSAIFLPTPSSLDACLPDVIISSHFLTLAAAL